MALFLQDERMKFCSPNQLFGFYISAKTNVQN